MQTLTAAKPKFVFRKAGSHWDVVFDGSETFHLLDKLGTQYIGHFLHHANNPVSSFDAERIIQPEKAQVRAKDSVQGLLDAEAVRQSEFAPLPPVNWTKTRSMASLQWRWKPAQIFTQRHS